MIKEDDETSQNGLLDTRYRRAGFKMAEKKWALFSSLRALRNWKNHSSWRGVRTWIPWNIRGGQKSDSAGLVEAVEGTCRDNHEELLVEVRGLQMQAEKKKKKTDNTLFSFMYLLHHIHTYKINALPSWPITYFALLKSIRTCWELLN